MFIIIEFQLRKVLIQKHIYSLWVWTLNLKLQKGVNIVVYYSINKNFKKHDSICDICYNMLDDDRDSGGLHIAWTENQKFRIFTNIYQYLAQRLMQIEQPKNIAGFLDLRHKYKGQYSV